MSYGGGYGGGGGGCELSSLSPSQPVRAPSHSPSRAFTSSWADPPLISSPLLGARACPSDGGGGGGYGGGGGGCRSPFSPPTSQQLRIGRSSLTTPLFPILVTQTAAVAEATAAAEVAATVAAEAATAEVRMAPAAVATAEGALAEVRPKNAHQHIPHRQSGVPFAVRTGAHQHVLADLKPSRLCCRWRRRPHGSARRRPRQGHLGPGRAPQAREELLHRGPCRLCPVRGRSDRLPDLAPDGRPGPGRQEAHHDVPGGRLPALHPPGDPRHELPLALADSVPGLADGPLGSRHGRRRRDWLRKDDRLCPARHVRPLARSRSLARCCTVC